jgi:hypothetical protein
MFFIIAPVQSSKFILPTASEAERFVVFYSKFLRLPALLRSLDLGQTEVWTLNTSKRN